MKLEQYELVFDRTKTNFDFISEGPKGRILKTEKIMKNISLIEDNEGTNYDPILDEYVKKHPNPFPKKQAMATAFIEKHGLPTRFQPTKKHKSTRSSLELTVLQKELLHFYANEPSEQQMKKLKDFMVQLLAEEVYQEERKARLTS